MNRADGGAVFSPDRVYRYSLWRTWDASLPVMTVIGLNPSTADEETDDPTIRRCLGFAKREGCGALVMVNLFAIRATDPREMLRHPSPVGPDNDVYLRAMIGRDGPRVAGWGAHGSHRDRDKQVRASLPDLLCFGITKGGHPRHPLYLAADTPLVNLPTVRPAPNGDQTE